MPITFHELEVRSNLTQRRALKKFLTAMAQTYFPGRAIEVQYIFCSDDYLLDMNQTYLQHDTLTDIITFDLSEDDKTLVAEVYISISRVAENAQLFQVSYEQELQRVIFHGMLHLCGFKDKTPKEQAIMRNMEATSLEAFAKSIATS